MVVFGLVCRCGTPGAEHPTGGKPPLFIMLDGTRTEARKMFRKARIWMRFRFISVDLSRISAYHLREPMRRAVLHRRMPPLRCSTLQKTRMAARALGDHFSLFRTRYLAGKRSIRAASQHKWQKAFKIIRSLGIKGDRYEPTKTGSTAAAEVDRRYWRINETTARRLSDDA